VSRKRREGRPAAKTGGGSSGRGAAPPFRPAPGPAPGDARQARLAAIVMAATVILWLGFSYVGGAMGWDPRYAILADMFALAAFFWALVVTWRLWRRRREG